MRVLFSFLLLASSTRAANWYCYKDDGHKVGSVKIIDWAETDTDATRACNEWRGACDLRCTTAKPVPVLDQNSFFVYNKKWNEARLAQWNTGERDFGTFEGDLSEDQIWILEVDPQYPGTHRIVNDKHSAQSGSTYRLGMYMKNPNGVIIYGGNHYEDQMWKFELQDNGYWTITNKKYNIWRLRKWGDNDWSGDQSVIVVDPSWGPIDDSDLWDLVPRYEAQTKVMRVFDKENHSSSTSNFEYREKRGISTTTTTAFKQSYGFKLAVKGAFKVAEVSSEFTMQFEQTDTSSETEFTEKEITSKYEVKPGKHVIVFQKYVSVEGALDEFSFWGDGVTIICEKNAGSSSFDSDDCNRMYAGMAR